jgi:hypothetical protein
MDYDYPVFTFEDSTGSFPDEVSLRCGSSGLQVLRESGEKLLAFNWDSLKWATPPSLDPEDMDILRITVNDSTSFSFECDDARAIASSFEMFVSQEEDDPDGETGTTSLWSEWEQPDGEQTDDEKDGEQADEEEGGGQTDDEGGGEQADDEEDAVRSTHTPLNSSGVHGRKRM